MSTIQKTSNSLLEEMSEEAMTKHVNILKQT